MKPIVTTAFSRHPAPGQTVDAPMKIAVAYHDASCLVKAIQFCDRIVQEHWEEFEIECTWWKFGFLRHPQIFSGAVTAASEADLILLSMPPERKLSQEVENWIGEWLECRQLRSGALVSLIPRDALEDDSPRAMESYFQEVAQRALMDYFPHHLKTFGKTEDPPAELDFSSRILELLPEDHAISRWGINE